MVLGKYVGVSDHNQMSFVNNIASMFYGSSKLGYMKWNLPLWFVPCFFATMCIFNVIVNFLGNRKWNDCKLLLVSVALLIIGYVISNVCYIYLPFQLETSMNLLFFVVCGYLCSKAIGGGGQSVPYVSRSKKAIVGVAAILIGCILSFFNDGIGVRTDTYGMLPLYIFIALLMSVGVIGVSVAIEQNKCLEYIGRHSFFIMLFHRFVLMFFSEVFPLTRKILSDTNNVKGTLVAVCISLTSVIICLVGEHILCWSYNKSKRILRKKA